jgi:Fur family transcriptional regulator, ferric uptake regulator
VLLKERIRESGMKKELLKGLFKDKSLRISQPRFLVYEELSRARMPLSPQELYQGLLKKHRKIGLTSIYRSLDRFESLGMVFKIVRGPTIRYKLCRLRNHHHHIICIACGRITEFDYCDISSWVSRVAESTGYQVTDHQFSFTGLCGSCRRQV